MEKKFYLSSTDKVIGGVCGGIAEYFGIKSSIVRIATVVLTLFAQCSSFNNDGEITIAFWGGLIVLAYFVMLFTVKRNPNTISTDDNIGRTSKGSSGESTEMANGVTNMGGKSSQVSAGQTSEESAEENSSVEVANGVTNMGGESWQTSEESAEENSSVEVANGVTNMGGESSQVSAGQTSGESADENSSFGFTLEFGNSERKNLERVVIPASLKSIEEYAYSGCEKLKEVDFSQCTDLEEIGKNAFNDCKSLERVVLPASLKFIKDSAFYGCENLKEVDFSQCTHLEEIGDHSFDRCENLERVDFSQCTHLEEIGERSFLYCGSIERVALPPSLKSIKDSAFSHCKNLKEIDFSQCTHLEEIGSSAFHGCRFSNIFIPDYVKTIGSSAFSDNGKIESVTIGKSATGYGNYTQSEDNASGILKGCSIHELTIKAEAAEYIGAQSITKVVLCDTVKELRKWAFYECGQLEEIVIPDSVTKIGIAAFWAASSLSSVVIPDSVTEIEEAAFDKTNLKTIVFPKELESLGRFGNMEYLRRLDFSKVTKLKVIPQEFLYGVPKLRELTLPMGVVTIKDHFGGENLNTLFLPPTVEEVGEVGYNMSIYCFSPELETLTAIADGAQDAKDSEDVKDGDLANRLYVLPEYLDDYKRLQKKERISEDLLKIDIIPDDELHHYDV